jgi:YVTN family beta-propeller protein
VHAATLHFNRQTTAQRRRRALLVALAGICAAGGLLGSGADAQAAASYTAYVANWISNSVTPVDTASHIVGSPIAVGTSPTGIAITPDGRTAYVANFGSNTVTPINTATNAAGGTIAVGEKPALIAITPNGQTAYVADYGANAVTPIDIASNTARAPIVVGSKPVAVAITPDGKTAYVTNVGDNTVTPITVATDTAGIPIPVGSGPIGIAVSPDGKTVYVTNSGSDTVTPITVATNTAGTPISVGSAPIGIAISPDGTSAYVANSGYNTITPIGLATSAPGAPITVGDGPWGIAITPDGASAYVSNLGDVPFTGNTTSGSTLVGGIASTARLALGMTVTGSGIPEGTTISAITSNTVTLSKTATATASGAKLIAWGPSGVTPVDLSTQLAGTALGVNLSFDAEPAITPDQAPVASFTVSANAAGGASSFDASASTVAYGNITSYSWDFGDGSSVTTSSPSVTHVYNAAGTYTATLTETDSAGTSTTQVFTGQTVSRNGGPSAATSRAVTIAAPAIVVPPIAAPAIVVPPIVAPAPKPSPVVISTRSARLTARGDIVVTVGCPATARGGCRGTVTIRLAHARRRARAHAAKCARGCRPLGSAKYEARAGQRARVRIHMTSFGRHLLARRTRLLVTATATSVSGGHTATFRRTMTLLAHTRAA